MYFQIIMSTKQWFLERKIITVYLYSYKNNMRKPMQHIRTRLFTGTIAFMVLMGLIQAGIDLHSWSEKHKRPLESRLGVLPPPGYTAQYQSTAHEIIELEVEFGLVSHERGELATAILDRTIEDFADLNVPEQPTMHELISLLKRVGLYIGKRYIYGGNTFADGLADGEIDCDLRSYLYLAIAENLGVQGVGVMYSPGHAFIGWRSADKHQFPIAWETTTDTGEIANFASSQYRKVSSYDHEYQIQQREGVLAMYRAIIADHLFDKGEKAQAKDILLALKEEDELPYYQAVLSQFEDGIGYAKNYLSHTNSQYARYLIANDLYNRGEKEEALKQYQEVFAETTYDKTVTDRLGELHSKAWVGWYIKNIYGPTARGLDRLFGNKDESKVIAEFAQIMPVLFMLWMIFWFAITDALEKRFRPTVIE
ncbi:hypothetical protein [Maricurvus nonylphenolicus]|jgi:hypothetical protein|uniref:hypothetical protein n=1 Tax=Maricurvus nonylphenolicus TaxID=1008307 RepID=UPI0036F2AE63